MLTAIFISDLTKVQETIDELTQCGLQCKVVEHDDGTEIQVYVEGS